jgi:hypothetical protein
MLNGDWRPWRKLNNQGRVATWVAQAYGLGDALHGYENRGEPTEFKSPAQIGGLGRGKGTENLYRVSQILELIGGRGGT